MAKIRNEELVALNGEVLPERTVLSAVPMDGGSGITNCSPNNQDQIGSQNGNWFSGGVNNPQCAFGSNTSDDDAHGGLLDLDHLLK